MSCNPLEIGNHAKALIVEQLMAVYGRSTKDPVATRKYLERFTLRELAVMLDRIIESNGNPETECPMCGNRVDEDWCYEVCAKCKEYV